MKTMHAFVEQHEVTMVATLTDEKPPWHDELADNRVAWRGTSWSCEISRNGESMTVPFFQGEAHTGEPEAKEVLDCLASDASGADQSFEDWADDYGYSTDSRRAYSTWEQIRAQTADLVRVLGDEAFEELLYETERL